MIGRAFLISVLIVVAVIALTSRKRNLLPASCSLQESR